MDCHTEQLMKKKAEDFFELQLILPPHQMEAIYQGFKARLIYELRIDGGAHEGVVSGNLTHRQDLRP